MKKKGYGLSFLLLIVAACGNEHAAPKPRAYPRVEYPKHEFQNFSEPGCPFTFEYPTYGAIQMRADHPCWFDVYMESFNARLHCSYLPVKDRADFDHLVRDAYTIADKINERANYMEEARISNSHSVGGLELKFSGPAASPLHFFLSDTTQHFFKASLYFESKVRPDSLAPIVKFVEEDIHHLIQSFQWNH